MNYSNTGYMSIWTSGLDHNSTKDSDHPKIYEEAITRPDNPKRNSCMGSIIKIKGVAESICEVKWIYAEPVSKYTDISRASNYVVLRTDRDENTSIGS